MGAPSTDRGGIQQVIRALKAADHTLNFVYDGGEDVDVNTEAEAVEAITAVDDAYLHVILDDSDERGWVRFVMGNEPFEVVCDHTVNLSPVLDPLTESWDE